MSVETTRKRQSRFAIDAARLILKAQELGYEVTFGEAWRTPEQAKWNESQGIGTKTSLHTERLAIDINLFKDEQLITDSHGHFQLGEWWKSLGDDHYWGGDFKGPNGTPKPDGNHYSISPDGGKRK